MDFYEVFDQVIDLLRNRGRVTYRTLRRQFALDDEALEDLKEELLFSHPVVDEAGRGLVWTGDTEASSTATSQPTTASEPSPTRQDQPAIVEPSLPEPLTPDAERRQLTVMFATWPIPPSSQANSTPKTYVTSSAPISPPVPR